MQHDNENVHHDISKVVVRRRSIGSERRERNRRGEREEELTTVLSVMAHNGRLPFPISSPACNRADATSVDRISPFCRSRTGFLGSPDFHISPRSQSYCSPPLCPFPSCAGKSVSLALPAATTVTGDYGKATRRDGDNGRIACVRGRDRVAFADGERDVGNEGTDRSCGRKGWRSEKGASLSPIRSNSDPPALLSRHANSTTAG